MQIYQDKLTGEEWHFEDCVNVATLNSIPATLAASVVARPAGINRWDAVQGGWVPDVAAQLEENHKAALSRIEALEARQVRPLRELMLDASNTLAKNKLGQIDAEIAELREQLK
ncbi:MAG: hypothetical protein EPO42_13255 [Gallionellaceae bacterium]|nr:MAG: hypothetical protein EPO42_13255 [Gallionellaceae bacterium]